MKKLKIIIIRLLIIIPIALVYLGVVFQDSFYLILAGVFFLFILLLNLPSVLSERKLHFPKLKRKKAVKSVMPSLVEEVKKFKLDKQWFRKNILSNRNIIFWSIWCVLLVVAFSVITITQLKSAREDQVLYLNYLYSLSSYLNSMWQISITILSFSLLFFTILKIKDRKKNIKTLIATTLVSLMVTILGVAISSQIAFASSYLFGIIHTQYTGYQISNDESQADIAWDKDTIKEKLQQRERAPQVLGAEANINKTIIETKIASNGFIGEFYFQDIISNIPASLTPNLDLPKSSMLLVSDYLFINELNKEDIEAISPTLGKLLVKQHFDPRFIKDEPKAEVLGRQEYLKYREEQINEHLAEIDGYIDDINNALNIAYAGIQEAKDMIAANEASRDEAIAKRESLYNECKNATCYTYSYSYYSGIYSIPYSCYSDAYCNSLRSRWDNIVAGFEQNIRDWQDNLNYYQGELPYLQQLSETLAVVRQIVESKKATTPNELGLFEEPDRIKIVLDSTSSEAISDYLATLVHEYLHYTSYVSEERVLPLFFEEGLTEYLSRKVIQEELNTDTHVGYQLIIPVIKEMGKQIGDDTFEEIYFTKNETRLVNYLNEQYGSEFYEESKYYFFALAYGHSDESIKMMNNILFKIGGEEITREELFSENDLN